MIAIDLDFAQRFNKRDRECSQLTCHFLKQVDKNDLNFKNRKKRLNSIKKSDFITFVLTAFEHSQTKHSRKSSSTSYKFKVQVSRCGYTRR